MCTPTLRTTYVPAPLAPGGFFDNQTAPEERRAFLIKLLECSSAPVVGGALGCYVRACHARSPLLFPHLPSLACAA